MFYFFVFQIAAFRESQIDIMRGKLQNTREENIKLKKLITAMQMQYKTANQQLPAPQPQPIYTVAFASQPGTQDKFFCLPTHQFVTSQAPATILTTPQQQFVTQQQQFMTPHQQFILPTSGPVTSFLQEPLVQLPPTSNATTTTPLKPILPKPTM
ncbi:F20 [Felid gammaherpesvirus 1]|uniref:F20 n=1 Tax=Felid gammaherpesvirus 1 TaxID=2560468 RepID=A0A0M4MDB5_9GAMA|nr:F20 [Felis catus gammaherpesvirus 1]ALE14763.1 F20 [Felis catus gammaherpesvirus 1]